MDTELFLEIGFNKELVASLPEKFAAFILSHYSEMELRTLSSSAIIKSASILYSVHYPDEAAINANQLIAKAR